ncbi:deoxyhypusine hydroxylase [Exophiala xenobiotica]|uniref:Deoxyhypusine hydroxylase n=1 Tax=Vermiconidia calcicola TaxID=1690605 RepID=A0AAV9Q334_9PEZI|nr:deoxyhypusine hydroxylase [Exophiala xenobiotica]KAK5532265.1 deoxyhypusine hydroxylase [Vermiconidia calcicola]KAK5533608.1 deoxyhypusine hydroxylase [Chaetothyriales sp. CCFEE 6169]KAK5204056.1 deoxyhypusine hydroxylase [Exophiala xenobiotica]KAK5216394.1 deoxyhypusine hydroxylase [Exophiala xenobiotica]
MAPAATEAISSTIDPTILVLRKDLTSEHVPLARRFRALFSLKHLASQSPGPQATAAIEAIAAAFASPSALLKHELAYCLGQTKNLVAVPFLRGVLENRHEAAEALGALNDLSSLELMKQMKDDKKEPVVVRETCDIAVDRIQWAHSESRKAEALKSSDFASIDPAPPMPLATETPSIPDLQNKLLDTSLPLFQRYRAMFALRDLASPPDLPTAEAAVHALASGFIDPSALFRHEVAFVFGQLSHPASIPALFSVLENSKEESMVRHEAAEALGSLGEEPGVENMLRKFIDDPEQVVRESVIVALDMAEYEKNGEMEYATIPEPLAA